MIFVSVGSQKFQFNRLLQKIDELIEKGIISDDVFAQIGYSDYVPKHYSCEKFLSNDLFLNRIRQSNVLITHAGTGSIIAAVSEGKKVIAIPRQVKFGEHVDDHQIQIIEQFAQMNIIIACYDMENLPQSIQALEHTEFKPYKSNTKAIIDDISEYLRTIK